MEEIRKGQIEETIPDALGRGFLSINNSERALLVKVENAELIEEPEIITEVSIVDSIETFERIVKGHLKINSTVGMGNNSVTIDTVEEYKSSLRELSLALTKRVYEHRFFLRDPLLRQEALDLFNQDRMQFIYRYGDQLIRTVRTGGYLNILYNFSFTDKESMKSFKGEIEGSLGQVNGAASFHDKVTNISKKANLKISSYCSGMFDAPPVYINIGSHQGRSTNNNAASEQVSEILKYFDQYENKVFEADASIVLYYDVFDSKLAVNAPFLT